jgi:hypothetical protein
MAKLERQCGNNVGFCAGQTPPRTPRAHRVRVTSLSPPRPLIDDRRTSVGQVVAENQIGRLIYRTSMSLTHRGWSARRRGGGHPPGAAIPTMGRDNRNVV